VPTKEAVETGNETCIQIL